ncbi:MAG TPA: MBOAT family O-acyltransferase [Candidatus Polarisedimenticolia bacterium]|nr:MBOAT family O-acyltransferase [Candidatus Polarisedimenticolia bacterium]
MTVASLEFLLCLWTGSAIVFRLPAGAARRAALLLADLVVLWLLLPNLASALFLGLVLLSGYGVGQALRARPRTWLFGLYLAALLAAFVVAQKYTFLDAIGAGALLRHPIAVAGLSYVLFRQIHYLVDALQGQIASTSPAAYLAYQINLFALLAGPIQRFQEFEPGWRDPRPHLTDRHDLLRAHFRVLIGVVKVAAIAAVLQYVRDKAWLQLLDGAAAPLPPGALQVLPRFAAAFYGYPAYVYFNFSGYCDIVIGGAALVGQTLPENFDRPYLSRNLLDFWTRWHRTLGFFIRDYLFGPMYKLVAERLPRQAPSLAFLCYFVAFFLAGVWHGSTVNFAIFGLLHGAGASTVKLWEMGIVKRSGRAGLRRYLASEPVRWAAIGLTLHYVAFAMLYFADAPGNVATALRLVGAALRPQGAGS